MTMAKLKFKFDIKKINWAPLKNFFIARGEKVALGLAVVIGVLLVSRGLISAKYVSLTADGRKIVDEIKKDTKTIRDNIDHAKWGVDPARAQGQGCMDSRDGSFPLLPFVGDTEGGPAGRDTPEVVAMSGLPRKISVAYLRAGVAVYDINLTNESATVIQPPGGGAAGIAKTVRGKRIVIVTALFPLKEQIEEFREKLKMSLADILNTREDLPHFLGVNVQRITRDTQGKETTTDLCMYDPVEEKVKLAPHLVKLFKEAEILDEGESFQQFQKHRQAGLMCNLPRLLVASYPHKGDPKNGESYPKPDLDGLQVTGFSRPVPPVKVNPPPLIKIPPATGRKPPPTVPTKSSTGTIKSGVKWSEEPIASSGLKAKFEGTFTLFDKGGARPAPFKGKPLPSPSSPKRTLKPRRRPSFASSTATSSRARPIRTGSRCASPIPTRAR